jgi:ATP-dependent phosphofructokinase / diphosphate-dependent phosphofructokinase
MHPGGRNKGHQSLVRNREPVTHQIKKIAINTGGGDAPGLNAVIRAATISALSKGWEVIGCRDGFNGILQPQFYGPRNPGTIILDRQAVRGITHLGGTILGTTNRGNPLAFPLEKENGEIEIVDRCPELVEKLREMGVDALVAIGGDGSMQIAQRLAELGMPTVGVPKTIDNDLLHTVETFGFDTAVSFATDAVDRLHSTAHAHQRTMIVEVMGRYAGWIALHAGVAGTADIILMPEIPYDIEKVLDKVRQRYERGHGFCIIVIAEGAKPLGGTHSIIGKSLGQAERLGGAGAALSAVIGEQVGVETRCTVLGHLQRGGSPTSRDRLLSLRFGSAAVRTLAQGISNVMVVLDPPEVKYVSLDEVIDNMKLVPLDCDTVQTARDLGVCLGD